MPKTQTLKVTVADDMETPINLVVHAVQRFVHSDYLVRDTRYYNAEEVAEARESGVVVELVETEA